MDIHHVHMFTPEPMITDRDVEKFQTLYEKENGNQISKAEALECLESMVDMLRHIYKPIKKKLSPECTKENDTI